MPDLTILHTSDLHGKLTKSAGDIITREKQSHAPCLLLDGGDAIPSGNVYFRPRGEPILAFMSDVGYDAMALGNREFHFLKAGLVSKTKLARFPVLCANIRCKSDSIEILPSIIFELGGLKVGVFGLTVPMITREMAVSKISPFWFESPIPTANELVPSLRERVDIVIALTHIGLKVDIDLANTVPGIDIVLGGHSHDTLKQPIFVGDTAVIHSGWWGRSFSRVEISASAQRKVVSATNIELSLAVS